MWISLNTQEISGAAAKTTNLVGRTLKGFVWVENKDAAFYDMNAELDFESTFLKELPD